MDSSFSALLTQHNEEDKEHALYYLSRTMEGAELNYFNIEKICLSLILML